MVLWKDFSCIVVRAGFFCPTCLFPSSLINKQLNSILKPIQTTPVMSDFEPLTSTVKPLTQSVLTIRIIKSFPYRNVKNIILKDYDIAHKTPKDLFEDVTKEIKSEGGLRPYRNVEYDTLKIYTHAHGSKTMNLVINFEHDDDWTLDLNSTSHLHELGVDNETEISIFNKEAYEEYKKNPIEKW